MKERLKNLVKDYKQMLPRHKGAAREVLENVIIDLQRIIDNA